MVRVIYEGNDMRRIYIAVIIIFCSLYGCHKEQSYPDYKSVIAKLQKNDFYLQCIGHYIVKRRGENQFFYMSDSIISPVFFERSGKAVMSNDQLKYIYDELQKKSVPNIQNYIKEVETKASVIIPFMKENGVFSLYGSDYGSNKGVFLNISLEDNFVLFFIAGDFDEAKTAIMESHKYVDRIDNWLIVKRENANY